MTKMISMALACALASVTLCTAALAQPVAAPSAADIDAYPLAP